jgi:hypothetical protein
MFQLPGDLIYITQDIYTLLSNKDSCPGNDIGFCLLILTGNVMSCAKKNDQMCVGIILTVN